MTVSIQDPGALMEPAGTAEPQCPQPAPASMVTALASPLLSSDLHFNHCVDRRLVHRASISEVFVTDAAQIGEHEFVVAGQLPRGHSMCESNSYDFNILLEFNRQASIYVTHRYLGVPTDGNMFLLRNLEISATPRTLQLGSETVESIVHLTMRPRYSRGRLTSADVDIEVHMDGTAVMRGGGTLMVAKREAWHAMRRRGRDQALQSAAPAAVRQLPAPPSAVGRSGPRNVVVSAPAFGDDGVTTAWLVVDLAHPYMFDHALDHLPGNLILEGARQAAISSVAMCHGIDPFAVSIYQCATDFRSFGELDLATRLTTRLADLRYDNETGATLCPVEVSVEQGDRVVTAAKFMVGAVA